MRGLFAAGIVLASMLVDATAIAPKALSADQQQIKAEVKVVYHKADDHAFITKDEFVAALDRDLADLAELQYMVAALEHRIAVSQRFLTTINTNPSDEPSCDGSLLCRIKAFFNRLIGLHGDHRPGGGGCHGRPNRTHGNHTHGNHTFPRPPWFRPHPGKGNHSHPHRLPFFCRPFHHGHGNHTHGNHTHGRPPHHGPPHHKPPHHGPPHRKPPHHSGPPVSCVCTPSPQRLGGHGPPLFVKILVIGTILAVLAAVRRRCHARMGLEGMTWRERRAARRERCRAKRAEMRRRWAAWWAGRVVAEEEEGLLGEKEKMVEEEGMSMAQEIASFREAASLVGEMVDVEAGKGEVAKE